MNREVTPGCVELMTSSRRFCALLCLLLCGMTQPAAQTPELRQSWRAAWQAIRTSGAQLPDERSQRRYALYPYLESAAIVAGLRRSETYAANITKASDFLARYADTAVADTLRRDLLFTLSELDAWQDFVSFYASEAANVARECEYLRARVSLDLTDGLAPLVEARWLTPQRLNAACEPAFRWLRQTGVLDAELTGKRIELLLDNGQTDFARVIAGQLPAAEMEAYLQWAAMLDSPLDTFDALDAGTLEPLHPAALAMVWSQASIQTPAETLEHLPAVPALIAVDADQAAGMRQELALGLAWDRQSAALEVFAAPGAAVHDDYSLGWLTRSAIWNGEWETAARALASLSPEAAEQSDWLYWRARAAQQLGRTQEAIAAWESLLGRDNFYSALAAAWLGRDVVPNEQPAEISRAQRNELAERDAFIRARELFLAGERILATREWRYATHELNDDQLAAAMSLAADWGWHDIAVATATRAGIFFDYQRLYPQPWVQEIERAAESQNLAAPVLSGLIRQESLFRPDAVSSAGAIGLTQLGLATARRTAASIGWPRPDRSDLFRPQDNMVLGAATLASGLQRFEQQLPVALAAYNAGPGAAQRWLPENPMASDIWIENIPYNETREYVRRVLWNSIVYSWLLGDEAPVESGFLLSEISVANDSAR